jgi:hypothetical protein
MPPISCNPSIIATVVPRSCAGCYFAQGNKANVQFSSAGVQGAGAFYVSHSCFHVLICSLSVSFRSGSLLGSWVLRLPLNPPFLASSLFTVAVIAADWLCNHVPQSEHQRWRGKTAAYTLPALGSMLQCAFARSLFLTASRHAATVLICCCWQAYTPKGASSFSAMAWFKRDASG